MRPAGSKKVTSILKHSVDAVTTSHLRHERGKLLCRDHDERTALTVARRAGFMTRLSRGTRSVTLTGSRHCCCGVVNVDFAQQDYELDRGTEVGPHSQCGEKIPVWAVGIEIKIASFAVRADGWSLIA